MLQVPTNTWLIFNQQKEKDIWYSMPAKANTVISMYNFIIFKAQWTASVV
jgi:hypothetical protein